MKIVALRDEDREMKIVALRDGYRERYEKHRVFLGNFTRYF
jgi:hypothetical protein